MTQLKSAMILAEDHNPDLEQRIQAALGSAGYVSTVAIQTTAWDISIAMGSEAPSLLVLVANSLTADLVQQLEELDTHSPLPVMLFAQQHNAELLERAVHAGTTAYHVGEFSAERLALLASLATARYSSRQKLKNDAAEAKAKLQERKLVERAKGILMEKKQLSEQDAYRVMRQAAMNRAQPMVQVAASVIQVSELLNAS